jgi:hypothetical protein
MDQAEEHFLNDTWSLYFHDPNDTDWGRSSFRKIIDVFTIEEFWKIHALIQGRLHLGMFFLMREGIFPLWEEKENKQGGYISLKILKSNVPDVWEKLSASLLSESMLKKEHSHLWNQINGISISPKKSFCIFKVWLRSKDVKDGHLYNVALPEWQDALFKAYDEDELTKP